MNNFARTWLIASILCFTTITIKAQCPIQLSSSFSGGQLILTYNAGEYPLNLQSIIVEFPGLSGSYDLTSTSSTTWQTLAADFDGITLTGMVRIRNTSGGQIVCEYINGLPPADPLPVELSSFRSELQGEDVLLDWTTATETNNAGFSIERSFNGESFETIGSMIGAGTVETAQQYSFRDAGIRGTALSGTAYYRLRQVDYDGSITFSTITAVDLGIETSGFAIRKITGWNSADRILRVYYYSPAAIRKVDYQVANLSGQSLLREATYPETGFNYLEIDLSNFSESFVILSMYNGKEIIVEKVGLAAR